MTDSLRGRLLVATPRLGDENFERTVVLLLEHGPAGALGVVLNRPSGLEVAEPLPGWSPLAAEPPVVFVGGPVSPGVVIGLAHSDAEVAGWQAVIGPLGTVDLNLDPADVTPAVDRVRAFAGYAGWSGGQLEGEIEDGAWFVVDAHPDDALDTEPDDLWRRVLRRQPGRVSWFANHPLDPSFN
jgi:putative transcriptional regulator